MLRLYELPNRWDYIEQALASLPDQRTPNKRDWERLSRNWQPLLQQRIDTLTQLRDQLSSCVGCGCLSLTSCALYNPDDLAVQYGSGARYLMKNSSRQVVQPAKKNFVWNNLKCRISEIFMQLFTEVAHQLEMINSSMAQF